MKSIREILVRFGAVGPVALFTGVGPLVGSIVLAATVPLWLDGFLASPFRGPLFLVLTALLAGLSLSPTHASSLLAGMAFGVVGGSAMALLGTLLAAALGFLTLRHFLRGRFVEALAHHPRAEAVHRELDRGSVRRTFALLALIRLSPVLPFAATNLLMSTTGLRLLPFLSATLVGIAPRVVAVVWIGSSLTELDLSQGGDRRLLALGVVATCAVLWILGRMSRRGLARLSEA
ncbi:MAG: VTT domain-containing protein [Planctomycetota bacterium]